MSFQDKIQAAEKELNNAGIWKFNRNLPVLSFCRTLGFNVRPPHYRSFTSNLLIAGVWFGFVWGLFMWFTSWQPNNMSLYMALIVSCVSGGLFGTWMALYYKWSAKKNNLSSWDML